MDDKTAKSDEAIFGHKGPDSQKSSLKNCFLNVKKVLQIKTLITLRAIIKNLVCFLKKKSSFRKR